MSNISPKDAWPVKLMRWVARFLSIPWAYWTLFWTWFVLGHAFQGAVLAIIMTIPLLMFLGAAIIAGVWGKEVLGGVVLLIDGVLLFAVGTLGPHSPMLNGDAALSISTIVLPPLVAGYLFLACHRRSKTSGEQHAYKVTSDKCRECGRKIRENERACIVDGELVCSECEQKQ
jgi:hypothetical protein